MIVITFSRALVQEMCGRLGAATGRGLLDLIRERFGLGWAMFAVAVILIANGSLVMTEFVGIGAAAELFGVSKFVAAPAAAALIWYLGIFGNYVRVEKIFLLMTLVFFAYTAAAVLGRPDWGAVARGAFVPTLRHDPDYFLLQKTWRKVEVIHKHPRGLFETTEVVSLHDVLLPYCFVVRSLD